jgi:hypothetical protein
VVWKRLIKVVRFLVSYVTVTHGARNYHPVKILGVILKKAIVFLIMIITDLDGLYWSQVKIH